MNTFNKSISQILAFGLLASETLAIRTAKPLDEVEQMLAQIDLMEPLGEILDAP